MEVIAAAVVLIFGFLWWWCSVPTGKEGADDDNE